MAKNKVIFRLTAFSAAAGKYNPDAPLDGNEDNFYVDDDLSDEAIGRFQSDKDVSLSDCGCLMAVADGMGGMNAGEVASEIAVKTVAARFAPGKITPEIAKSEERRAKYLEDTIREADLAIKKDAADCPEHAGMGSTIIIAWLVDNRLTLSWCGDSRAYRFRPSGGLEPLSTDHSYVQELVNNNDITYDEAFDHPQGNIVTRSLGDPHSDAKPETRQFDVADNDIILLCSDGLSGVLRDRRTVNKLTGDFYPGKNIEDIIRAYSSSGSLVSCRQALMKAAEEADWYDNVTVILCKVYSGAGIPPEKNESVKPRGKKLNTRLIYIVIGLILVIAAIIAAFLIGRISSNSNEDKDTANDSIPIEVKVLETDRDTSADETIGPEPPTVESSTPRQEKPNEKEDRNPSASVVPTTTVTPRTTPSTEAVLPGKDNEKETELTPAHGKKVPVDTTKKESNKQSPEIEEPDNGKK